MSLPALFLLAVALGTDAFSLCLGIGMTGVRPAQVLAISATVFFFHVAMPLIGFQAGEIAGLFLGRPATMGGALILFYLGLRMIWEAFKCEDPPDVLLNGWGLFLLGASVSMDALSVGFTMGILRANLLFAVLVFGVVAGMMTLGGLLLGRLVGCWVGKRSRLFGGLILLGIGAKLFWQVMVGGGL